MKEFQFQRCPCCGGAGKIALSRRMWPTLRTILAAASVASKRPVADIIGPRKLAIMQPGRRIVAMLAHEAGYTDGQIARALNRNDPSTGRHYRLWGERALKSDPIFAEWFREARRRAGMEEGKTDAG